MRHLRLLALAPLAAALILAASAAVLAAPARAARPAHHPPVVMLMFDEFEFASLFDTAERFDPVRYPHFAALARQATVYRRFTAEGDITGPATSSLLASRPYTLGQHATYQALPHNLFTDFRRGGYGLTVREAATALCPHCPGDHAPHDAHDVLSGLAHGRVARFDAWLHTLHRTRHPALFFDHTLLPHGPQQFSPTGHRYNVGGEPIPGLNATPAFGDPWFVRQGEQRYLMQVELVDALVGRLEARMKATGLWNRALLVITADNGEAWGHIGSDPHRIDRHTLAEIVQTPLVVKLPGQRHGGYVNRRVRTIDLLPTMAHVAHVGVGRVAGRSFVGAGARRIPASPIHAIDDAGRGYRLTSGELSRDVMASIHKRVAIFAQHTRDLFHIGPSSALLGRQVSGLKVGRAKGDRVALKAASSLRHVSLRHSIVPTMYTGVIRGPKIRRRLPFAVAVDGTVRATGYTGQVKGSRRVWISALVPESALHAGRNAVRVFLLRGGRLLRVRLG